MSAHMRTVRLKVLMHQFYAEGDHRQKALVILQKSWTTVLQLQQHIQKIFRLPGQIYLTVDDGCLLPTDEDINVITETDSVTVQPVQTSFNLLADAFSNAHIYSANETTPGAWTSDVSSPGILQLAAPKRQKRHKTHADAPSDPPPMAIRLQLPGKSSKWIQDINSLDVAADDEDATDQQTTAVEQKTKRQRKRKRKRAKAPDSPLPADESASATVVAKTEPQSVPIFRVERTNIKAHIRFSEDGTAHRETADKETSSAHIERGVTVPPRNDPFPLPEAARVIRGICRTSQPKVTTEQLSTATVAIADAASCGDPVAAEPVVQTDDLAMEETTAAVAGSSSSVAASSSSSSSALETLRQNVPVLNLRAVQEPLKEKDMIAFRIMRLSDNYVPGMSEYIVGMVQAIGGADAAEISLHIMAGYEQTQQPLGKFSLDDAVETVASDDAAAAGAEANRSYHVQRADMFDVKYVQL